MEQTKEQLQKEIMEILYAKSLVKPVWVTCSEVYWNIQNIKVTERSVREALDWLVKMRWSYIKVTSTKLTNESLLR